MHVAGRTCVCVPVHECVCVCEVHLYVRRVMRVFPTLNESWVEEASLRPWKLLLKASMVWNRMSISVGVPNACTVHGAQTRCTLRSMQSYLDVVSHGDKVTQGCCRSLTERRRRCQIRPPHSQAITECSHSLGHMPPCFRRGGRLQSETDKHAVDAPKHQCRHL